MDLKYRKIGSAGPYFKLINIKYRTSEHDFYFSKFDYKIGSKVYKKYKGAFKQDLEKLQLWLALQQ